MIIYEIFRFYLEFFFFISKSIHRKCKADINSNLKLILKVISFPQNTYFIKYLNLIYVNI